jgi:hypothetical protein
MLKSVEAGVGSDVATSSPGEIPEPSKKRNIEPALKAWMDNVFVPAMVRQYLAEFDSKQDNGPSAISERVQ